MASLLWAKVYLHDVYVGRLQEEPGGRCTFAYDATYAEEKKPAISHTLPTRGTPFVCERGLHPFFDNLVAEGWLRDAQARALGVDRQNRFALLLGFGHDLAGAISVEDPDAPERERLEHEDDATVAALVGRASLSGIQRKLLIVRDGKTYRPVGPNEISTHIAKLASGSLPELLEVEYLTTQVVRALLPDDDIVDLEIDRLPSVNEDALVIRRFDRTPSGKRLHFEEFNQLLGKYSGNDKYDGTYEAMGHFIVTTPSCIRAEAYRLLRRVFACLLVGNTDAHFKNFAMFHKNEGLRLTPAYDLVASAYYPQFQSIALHIAGARNLSIGSLQPKHLLQMGTGFGVDSDIAARAIAEIGERLPRALATLDTSAVGSKRLRTTLQKRMEKRWNGSFVSTGRLSSKKQKKGDRD